MALTNSLSGGSAGSQGSSGRRAPYEGHGRAPTGGFGRFCWTARPPIPAPPHQRQNNPITASKTKLLIKTYSDICLMLRSGDPYAIMVEARIKQSKG